MVQAGKTICYRQDLTLWWQTAAEETRFDWVNQAPQVPKTNVFQIPPDFRLLHGLANNAMPETDSIWERAAGLNEVWATQSIEKSSVL